MSRADRRREYMSWKFSEEEWASLMAREDENLRNTFEAEPDDGPWAGIHEASPEDAEPVQDEVPPVVEPIPYLNWNAEHPVPQDADAWEPDGLDTYGRPTR